MGRDRADGDGMMTGIVAGQMRDAAPAVGDPYWDSVVSLAHFDADFVDAKDAVTWFNTAGLVIQGDLAAFGGSGAYSPGNSEWASRTIPALGLNNFTLEFRVKLTAIVQPTKRLFDIRSAGISGTGITLGLSSANILTLNVNGVSTDSVNVGPLTTVTSLCVERSGSTFTVYVDGVAAITYIAAASLPYTTLRMMNSIVNSAQWTTQGAQGLLDELRLTVGVARYHGNYTPKTDAFPDFIT